MSPCLSDPSLIACTGSQERVGLSLERIENFGALRDGIYAMLAKVLPEPLTDDLFDVAVPENTEGPP